MISRLIRTAATLAVAGTLWAAGSAQAQDPRVGLSAGMENAATAARNVQLVASIKRPSEFVDPKDMGNILFANSDMAFRGTDLFMGSFHGFQIYDMSDAKNPKLRTSFVCPGGQGDLSVHGNLLFMSVEMPNGRTDCGTTGLMTMGDSIVKDRFRGVRIFDITDLSKPKQVAAVQTCRGSHTHTLVTDPKDAANVYIYVAGTSGVRPAGELAGCMGSATDPNTSFFRIEVIKVPVAAPQRAAIVSGPRIFANASTGAVGGLWMGGAHGAGTQATARTDQCHDLTAFPEIGLVAGACSGNGLILDMSDIANPKRIDEVSDPNFAYWHSATFNNDGSKVIFTDEWGGGMAAHCLATDRKEWGANAIFDRTGGKLKLAGYYKLPAPQSPQENCVAHNGSLIPVPGRDIMAQAWYQGGMSIFDFTDPTKPVEIAYFDRGPYDAANLKLGGFWSTYWYNGFIYGSEISRGLDIFRLTPSEHLTQNEIDAAVSVRETVMNPQNQKKVVWPASFVVARAYVDQLRRNSMLTAGVDRLTAELDRVEKLQGADRKTALTQLIAELNKEDPSALPAVDAKRVAGLVATLQEMAR